MKNNSNILDNEPIDVKIIQVGNKQNIVTKSQLLTVDHIPDVQTGQVINLSGFSISNSGEYEEVKIPVKVIESTHLGQKIKIVKKRRRTRYRRTIGFRAKLTLVEIL